MGYTIIKPALTRLIVEKPFYGHMLFKLKVHAVNDIHIASVGVSETIDLYINPQLFKLFTLEEQKAILEHEVDHLVFAHFIRKGNRDHSIYNMACDIAINQNISGLPTKERIAEVINKVDPKQNTKDITGILLPSTFGFNNNLSAEKYYDLLLTNLKAKQLKLGKGIDDHSKWEDGNGLGKNILKEKIKELVRDAKNHYQAGSMPQHLRTPIEDLFDTSTPWKQALSRFLVRATLAFQSTSRKKPNRRFGIMFPGNKTEFQLRIAVGMDESGSIDEKLQRLFFSELDRLNIASPEIYIIHFDSKVESTELYKKHKPVERKCCGGTDFNPPIKKAEELGVDALIMLTDGEASLEIPKPKIPILWALADCHYDRFNPPFGNKIKLIPNKEW